MLDTVSNASILPKPIVVLQHQDHSPMRACVLKNKPCAMRLFNIHLKKAIDIESFGLIVFSFLSSDLMPCSSHLF